jgi:hypothetical protein
MFSESASSKTLVECLYDSPGGQEDGKKNLSALKNGICGKEKRKGIFHVLAVRWHLTIYFSHRSFAGKKNDNLSRYMHAICYACMH